MIATIRPLNTISQSKEHEENSRDEDGSTGGMGNFMPAMMRRESYKFQPIPLPEKQFVEALIQRKVSQVVGLHTSYPTQAHTCLRLVQTAQLEAMQLGDLLKSDVTLKVTLVS